MATLGAVATGVLLNKPQAGEAASVCVLGPSKVFAGGTIVAGGLFASTASGTAVAVASGNFIVGKALTGVASGGIFDAVITCAGYNI